MKYNTDLSKILDKKHESKWVALTQDRSKILGSNISLVRLKKTIRDNQAIYMKVLPSDRVSAF